MNINLLVQKAKEIRNAIRDLQIYTSTELEFFMQKMTLIDSTKYKLLITIEGCISICYHIVSRVGDRVPESYSDCFEILSKLDVITQSLAEKLMEMAKFRNLLIHLYWKVDDKRVYEIATDNLGDIEEFLDQVGEYLKEKE